MIVPCGTYILLNRHLSDALLNLDFFVSEYIIDDTNYLVFHVEQTIKGAIEIIMHLRYFS
jgi:hypothetical protein